MMLILQYYLGLRPMEARCIKLAHIKNKILYIPAENNKQRFQDTLPIPYFIYMKLISYINFRNKFFSNKDYLFPKKDNLPLDRGSHIRFFNFILKKCNLYQKSYNDKKNNARGNLTLNSLRHSFGTFAYSKLHDIKQVACLLRHHDFLCRSTLIYIHTDENRNKLDLFDEIYN